MLHDSPPRLNGRGAIRKASGPYSSSEPVKQAERNTRFPTPKKSSPRGKALLASLSKDFTPYGQKRGKPGRRPTQGLVDDSPDQGVPLDTGDQTTNGGGAGGQPPRAGDTSDGFTLVPGRRNRGRSREEDIPPKNHKPYLLSVGNQNIGRDIFARGDIWSIPYHMPNMDNTLTEPHFNLRSTCAGGVFSKYRYVVVVWRCYQTMVCVPITGFGDDAEAKYNRKPDREKRELLEIVPLQPQRTYTGVQPLKVEVQHEVFLTKKSWVRLAYPLSVEYNTDIWKVGRLTEESALELVTTMGKLLNEAKNDS